MAEEPTFTRHGDEFFLQWSGDGLDARVALTAVREVHDGVHAEVTITRGPDEIHWARLNLSSTTGRESLVKKLERADPSVPWARLLDRACHKTTDAIRQGSPTIPLKAQPAPAARCLVDPILPLGDTSVLYGDGGAGKGWTATALAVATATGAALPGGIKALARGPVLYLDWESTEDDLQDRLYLVSRGLGCGAEGIHYRRMSRAIADEISAVRAEVSRLAVKLVVVDSLAPACGAEPEGADAVIRAMNALRSLGAGVTRLVIAHVSHASATSQAPARPYGSVFVQNLARSTWELRASDENTSVDELVVGLYHRKVNRGRKHPPIGLRYTFGDHAITLERADLTESSDLMARTSVANRIRAALAGGAMSTKLLMETTGAANEDTITRTCRRMSDVVNLDATPPGAPARPARWGLKA